MKNIDVIKAYLIKCDSTDSYPEYVDKTSNESHICNIENEIIADVEYKDKKIVFNQLYYLHNVGTSFEVLPVPTNEYKNVMDKIVRYAKKKYIDLTSLEKDIIKVCKKYYIDEELYLSCADNFIDELLKNIKERAKQKG